MDNPGFLHDAEGQSETTAATAPRLPNSSNPFVIFSDNKQQRSSLRSVGDKSSISRKKSALLCGSPGHLRVGVRSPKLSSSSFNLPKNSNMCRYKRFSGSLSIKSPRSNVLQELTEDVDSRRNKFLSAAALMFDDTNVCKCESGPKCLGEHGRYIVSTCSSKHDSCADDTSEYMSSLYNHYPKSSPFNNDHECSKHISVPSQSLKTINDDYCSNSSFCKKEAQRYSPSPSLALLKQKFNNSDIPDHNFDKLNAPNPKTFMFKSAQSDGTLLSSSALAMKKVNQFTEEESILNSLYVSNNPPVHRVDSVEMKNKRNLREYLEPTEGISTISGQVPVFHPDLFQQPSPRPCADNRRNLRRSSTLGARARLKKRGLMRGWKLQFASSNHSRRRAAALGCVLALACLLILVATGLVIYVTTVMGTFPEKLASSCHPEEAGINVVAGEFRIVNERFEPSLKNSSSTDFKQLASQLSQQLNLLFSVSTLAASYNHSHVTSLSRVPKPSSGGVLVRCKLVLMSVPPHGEAANQAGLEFLRGLQHRQGQMWLGDFIVDVQSIGFVAVVDEALTSGGHTPSPALLPGWSSWSPWSSCNTTGRTQSRTRLCRLDRGAGSPLSSIESCLLVEGAGGDLEVRDCDKRNHSDNTSGTVMASSVLEDDGSFAMSSSNDIISVSTTAPKHFSASSNRVSESSDNIDVSIPRLTLGIHNISLHVDSSRPTSIPIMDLSLPSLRNCDECVPGEVCVALNKEQVPTCRWPHDSADPTGCGGHCRINTELCQKLDVDAFRCIDDSYCLSNEWRCGNQLCIPVIKRCDGHMNCYDRTDEHNCDCDLSLHFHCGNSTSCLPLKKRCDGIIDCWDGTDELNCTIACPSPTQFTCTDGQCIPRVQFCDGYSDCADKSDEPFGCGGECKNHEWKCRNGRCIRKQAVCDGDNTCGDQSDEYNCPRIRRENHSKDKMKMENLHV